MVLTRSTLQRRAKSEGENTGIAHRRKRVKRARRASPSSSLPSPPSSPSSRSLALPALRSTLVTPAVIHDDASEASDADSLCTFYEPELQDEKSDGFDAEGELAMWMSDAVGRGRDQVVLANVKRIQLEDRNRTLEMEKSKASDELEETKERFCFEHHNWKDNAKLIRAGADEHIARLRKDIREKDDIIDQLKKDKGEMMDLMVKMQASRAFMAAEIASMSFGVDLTDVLDEDMEQSEQLDIELGAPTPRAKNAETACKMDDDDNVGYLCFQSTPDKKTPRGAFTTPRRRLPVDSWQST